MRGARSLGDEVRSGREKQQDAVVGAVGWWSNAGVGGVCGFRHGWWVVDQVIDGVVGSGSGLSLKRQNTGTGGVVVVNRRIPPWIKMNSRFICLLLKQCER